MEHSFSQKRMIVMMLMIVVLLLGAVFYYIVYPSQNQIHELNSEIKTVKTFIDIAKAKQDDTTEKDEVEPVHTVPVGPSTDQLLHDLHKAEKQSDSKIIEFTVNREGDSDGASENTDEEGVQSFSYTITVQSPDYPSIYDFIDSIENSRRVYVVQELNLPERGDNGKSPFEYKLEVMTYFRASTSE